MIFKFYDFLSFLILKTISSAINFESGASPFSGECEGKLKVRIFTN